MVAFVASVLVAFVMVAAVFPFMKRRPVGRPLTWGEAMAAAAYVYFIVFWVYGVVPNQWLLLADNAWNWRSDRLISGPGGIIESLPFDVSYMVLRDIIVVGIYVVALGLNIAMWAIWQGRGEKKQKAGAEVEASRYGRPLVRGS